MIQSHPIYQKALKTNKITKAEADLFFSDLYKETDSYIRENWKFYVNKGMWPLRARLKDKAQKDPVFILNHCTGAKTGKFEPALHRFFQAEKASANFLITTSGAVLYLVPLSDMAYHATRNSSALHGAAITSALKIGDGKWLNEPGLETVGSQHKLFTPIQFEAAIVVQRIMVAYFNSSVKMLKSHRFFSPQERAEDPSFLYFLPLVEYSVFNDVDITKADFWLQKYKADMIGFANSSYERIQEYGLLEKDEWKNKRLQMKGKIDKKFLYE